MKQKKSKVQLKFLCFDKNIFLITRRKKLKSSKFDQIPQFLIFYNFCFSQFI